MKRITIKHLEGMCNRLNHLTGSPLTPYAPYVAGQPMRPLAGNYHISCAYSGFNLHRMRLNEGCTGVTTPLHCGHVPARELYNMIAAFIYGIESVTK